MNEANTTPATKAPETVTQNTKSDGSLDYDALERPTVMRQQSKPKSIDQVSQDVDYLDIPAFLRKKEDA